MSRSTLYRHFLKFKGRPCKPKPYNCQNEIILIDGTYLGWSQGTRVVVLVARTKTQVICWRFCDTESGETWELFLRRLQKPLAIVCDGQKGMLKAIRIVWNGEVTIQRCLFHLQSRALGRLTLNPKLKQAQTLRRICTQICKIDSIEQRDVWIESYFTWKSDNAQFLRQMAYYQHPQTSKLVYYYLHKSMRSVVASIDQALPFMFAYLENPDIPRTTNYLEGGTNARLKELIHRHRGTSMANKLVLTARYLRKQQKLP